MSTDRRYERPLRPVFTVFLFMVHRSNFGDLGECGFRQERCKTNKVGHIMIMKGNKKREEEKREGSKNKEK